MFEMICVVHDREKNRISSSFTIKHGSKRISEMYALKKRLIEIFGFGVLHRIASHRFENIRLWMSTSNSVEKRRCIRYMYVGSYSSLNSIVVLHKYLHFICWIFKHLSNQRICLSVLNHVFPYWCWYRNDLKRLSQNTKFILRFVYPN